MQKSVFLFLSILFLIPSIVLAQSEDDALFDKKAAAGSSFAGLEVGGGRKKEAKKTNEFDYSQKTKGSNNDKKKKSSLIIPTNEENVSSEQSSSPTTFTNQPVVDVPQNIPNNKASATAPSIEPKETKDIQQQLELQAVKEEQKQPVVESPAEQLSRGAMSPEYYKTLVDQIKTQTEKTADYNVYKASNPAINTKVTPDNRF